MAARNSGLILLDAQAETVIEFYKTHSTNVTRKYFKVQAASLLKFLKLHNIAKHTREEEYAFAVKARTEFFNLNYGCDNAMQVEEIKNKQQLTIKETYGNDYSLLLYEKAKQTKLDKYGSATYNNRVKAKETNLEKYGCENPTQNAGVRQKTVATNLNRYGVEVPVQNPDVQRKTHVSYWTNLHSGNYKFNDLIFDSLPELAFYIFNIDNNINIIREPLRLEYKFNNKKHYYFPDFEIDGQLIEIKGDHLYEKMHIKGTVDYAKLICLQDNNVKVLLKTDYIQYIDYCTKKYGQKWYLKYKNNV